ncbi:unnamed protein product [Caenorhabditis auriculariae]|uniref:Uncharacterized protein n=1 Tax=Caenorhabditis auriculariae TaxID=2777116 RepID=A0A8S1HJH9_9PELO|nr:unnamed protein product [Caenorhabditis auriculariae]
MLLWPGKFFLMALGTLKPQVLHDPVRTDFGSMFTEHLSRADNFATFSKWLMPNTVLQICDVEIRGKENITNYWRALSSKYKIHMVIFFFDRIWNGLTRRGFESSYIGRNPARTTLESLSYDACPFGSEPSHSKRGLGVLKKKNFPPKAKVIRWKSIAVEALQPTHVSAFYNSNEIPTFLYFENNLVWDPFEKRHFLFRQWRIGVDECDLPF